MAIKIIKPAPEAAVDDDEAAQAAGDQKEKSENECEM